MNQPMQKAKGIESLLSGPLLGAAISVASALFSPANADQNFSARVTGPINSQTIEVHSSPSSADLGRNGSTYVAAKLNDSLFFHNGVGWVPYAGADIPTNSSGTLTSKSTTVVSNIDLSSLKGAVDIFVGHGASRDLLGIIQDPVTDMLNGGKYAKVHTIGAFTVASPNMFSGESLPLEHTCDSAEPLPTSPAVNLANAPEGTKSYAITLTSNGGTEASWIKYGLTTNEGVVNGSIAGLQGGSAYAVPCPDKTATFRLTAYALSKDLSTIPEADMTLERFTSETKGNVLAESSLDATVLGRDVTTTPAKFTFNINNMTYIFQSPFNGYTHDRELSVTNGLPVTITQYKACRTADPTNCGLGTVSYSLDNSNGYKVLLTNEGYSTKLSSDSIILTYSGQDVKGNPVSASKTLDVQGPNFSVR